MRQRLASLLLLILTCHVPVGTIAFCCPAAAADTSVHLKGTDRAAGMNPAPEPASGRPARKEPPPAAALPVSAPASAAPESSVILAEPIRPTDTPATAHDANKTLDLTPLYLSTAVEMHSFRALRAEAAFDQSIRLRDAINYVLDHGLQVKNEREALIYQHWQTISQVAGALPNFLMSYSLSRSLVYDHSTSAIARLFYTGVSFPVFNGGGTVGSILSQYYREKAWRSAYRSTFQDIFLTVYQNYTNLLLQRVLLQIWAKAVEADQEQLRINKAQLQSGTGTKFTVLQTETQLAADRQSFLNQEVAMRKAALTLNSSLNYPMEVNLIPVEETLSEAPIFSEKVQLKDLFQDALAHSPQLRLYEYFRLTARRYQQVVAAGYYPSVAFFISWQFVDTQVHPAKNGFALGGAATSAINSSLNSTFAGRVNNNALGQQSGFDPTAGETALQGVNTPPVALPPVSLPPSAGGTPMNAMQSGSAVSSGAVAPSIFGGGTGSSSGSNSNGSLQAPSGVFPGLARELQMGFQFNWSVPSAALGTTAAVLQARTIARQALVQCNQELIIVQQTIRNDYLNMLAARETIDRAAAAVAASREALRIARVGLEGGVKTNLDVIAAQKDYITNLTAQAQAIVASNVAQAKLLHDIGMINATTLTTGYRHGVYEEPQPTKKIHWLYP
jgi:outer membrane protein TolC